VGRAASPENSFPSSTPRNRPWLTTASSRKNLPDAKLAALLTVGLVDWSLDRKGLTSGFVPEKVADDLDLGSVHLYPK
jgi:hypothetical protein